VYVTGRMKDLIIVAGRNLYPQDIELLVQETDARIRPNGVAAFSIDNGSKELIAIVVELRRGERFEAADLQSMHDAIVERVASQLGAAPHAIHFAPIGTIPLTTSGKVQRHATRQAFLAQSLASYLQPRG
jgi:acyl-CoA synthetase (AMP-forming)/AMP-acid ligase II